MKKHKRLLFFRLTLAIWVTSCSYLWASSNSPDQTENKKESDIAKRFREENILKEKRREQLKKWNQENIEKQRKESRKTNELLNSLIDNEKKIGEAKLKLIKQEIKKKKQKLEELKRKTENFRKSRQRQNIDTPQQRSTPPPIITSDSSDDEHDYNRDKKDRPLSKGNATSKDKEPFFSKKTVFWAISIVFVASTFFGVLILYSTKKNSKNKKDNPKNEFLEGHQLEIRTGK